MIGQEKSREVILPGRKAISLPLIEKIRDRHYHGKKEERIRETARKVPLRKQRSWTLGKNAFHGGRKRFGRGEQGKREGQKIYIRTVPLKRHGETIKPPKVRGMACHRKEAKITREKILLAGGTLKKKGWSKKSQGREKEKTMGRVEKKRERKLSVRQQGREGESTQVGH